MCTCVCIFLVVPLFAICTIRSSTLCPALCYRIGGGLWSTVMVMGTTLRPGNFLSSFRVHVCTLGNTLQWHWQWQWYFDSHCTLVQVMLLGSAYCIKCANTSKYTSCKQKLLMLTVKFMQCWLVKYCGCHVGCYHKSGPTLLPRSRLLVTSISIRAAGSWIA